jgi:hypothetical protein
MVRICKDILGFTHFQTQFRETIYLRIYPRLRRYQVSKRIANSLFWLNAHFAAKPRDALEAARCGDVARDATPERIWRSIRTMIAQISHENAISCCMRVTSCEP